MVKDEQTGEMRAKELTSLMIACIMGNMNSVKELVNMAKGELSDEEFQDFIDIKVQRNMGGNNALLYACNSSNSNFILVDYLIN